MLFVIKLQMFFLFSSLAGLSDADSFTLFSPIEAVDNNCAHRRHKENVLWCTAQCLGLEGESSRINCNMQTERIGCMPLNSSSEMAIKLKGMHFAFKGPNKAMCGKKFYFSSPIAYPHEYTQYACVIDTTLKTWNPKDEEEVKCLLSNLPLEWQKVGKIGIHAFKSRSTNKFKICEIGTPRVLNSTFLPILENKNVTLGTYNGTCAMITYDMSKDKVLSNLTLVEIPCEKSNAPYLCEVK